MAHRQEHLTEAVRRIGWWLFSQGLGCGQGRVARLGALGLHTQQVGWMRAERSALRPQAPPGACYQGDGLHVNPSQIPKFETPSQRRCCPVARNLPANAGQARGTGWILGQEDPLEKGMATHSSIFAWRIPWTEENWWATVHGAAKSLT